NISNIKIDNLHQWVPIKHIRFRFQVIEIRPSWDTDNFLHSALTLVTASDFAGLNTFGLSIAKTDLDVDGLQMPPSHPRASEILFVTKGVVLVGFVDMENKLFQKMLKAGDVFLFPRALLHFCLNAGFEKALVFSS
ncbi:Germin-like protein subfamily 3 member 4, partial [Linum perenne]